MRISGAIAGATLFCVTAAIDARAEPTLQECAADFEQGQVLDKQGQLIEAGAKFQSCAARSCPSVIQQDCAERADRIAHSTPSIALEIKVDGEDQLEAVVEVDGQRVADHIDAAHGLFVNPGQHTLTVTVPGFEPQEKRIVARAGEQLKLVPFVFERAPAAGPTGAAPGLGASRAEPAGASRRPMPTGAYVLFGVGGAAIAAAVVLYSIGKSDQTKLEHDCEPRCSDDQVNQVHVKYLAGDVAVAAGAAALAGGLVWYLARPTVRDHGPSVGIVPAGTYWSVRGEF